MYVGVRVCVCVCVRTSSRWLEIPVILPERETTRYAEKCKKLPFTQRERGIHSHRIASQSLGGVPKQVHLDPLHIHLNLMVRTAIYGLIRGSHREEL